MGSGMSSMVGKAEIVGLVVSVHCESVGLTEKLRIAALNQKKSHARTLRTSRYLYLHSIVGLRSNYLFLLRTSFLVGWSVFSSFDPSLNLLPLPFAATSTSPVFSKAAFNCAAISLTAACGVAPALTASNNTLSCNCPWLVMIATSTPALCSISPYRIPSSLNKSAEELRIRVGGCFAAFLAEMLRAVASSDVRSSGLGMYASIHLRRNGTVRKGPLKKRCSLGVSRSVVTVSVTGLMRIW